MPLHRNVDVVIVGAGPVGLSLALGLAKAGIKILVIEKQAHVSEHSRAPAIWPRTQEILADLGVIDEFLTQGIQVTDAYFWDVDQRPERELFHAPIHELCDVTRFAQLVILPQEKTAKILLAALCKQPSAEVLFSAELIELHQDAAGVEIDYQTLAGTQNVKARFAIGCDGAHSTVREKLEIHLQGVTYPIRAALADVRFADRADYLFPRISNRGVLAISLKIEENLWRLILLYGAHETLELDTRIQRSVEQLFDRPDYELVWKSEFTLHRRISESFVRGRIALAGDAAHLNSPVGGQGMNSGIQDGDFLKNILLQALAKDSPQELMTYDKLRRSAIAAGVNQFTNQLTRVVLLGNGAFLKLALRIGRQVLKIPALRRKFLLNLAMLPKR